MSASRSVLVLLPRRPSRIALHALAARRGPRVHAGTLVIASFCMLGADGVPVAARDDRTPEHPALHASDWKLHQTGSVRSLITNWGQIGSKPFSALPYASQPSAQWPGASGIEYLWSGGFWFGARQNGIPHVTTASYDAELRPGPTAADRIYVTRAGAPGGNRAPARADDDGDGRIDEDWLDGHDNDHDARVDEDFAGIADEMFAASYADPDSLVSPFPDHVPLGIEVRQASLAWSRPELDDFIGFDLRIANTGTTTLDDFHVGFFADCDIGPRTAPGMSGDDRAGFWEGTVTTTLEDVPRDVAVSIAYMYDGDRDGGQTPGTIGFVFLDAAASLGPRLRNFRMFTGSAAYASGGDPTNDGERFACLDGTAPASLPPPAATPRPGVAAPRDSDWRILGSIGPLPALQPGGALEIAMAMVLGGSLEDMLQNAARAQMLYDGVVADCDGDPGTPEECVVHWTTPRTVPVEVAALTAWREDGAVHLSWQLSPTAAREVVGVRPLRGASEVGPFQTCAAIPLAPTATEFDDRGAPDGILWYRLELATGAGTGLSHPVRVDAVPLRETGLDPPRLDASGVSIRWRLAADARIRLSIHDVNGRLVRGLRDDVTTAGVHTLEWDRIADSGVPVSRGVYLVRLETGTSVFVRKLALFVD